MREFLIWHLTGPILGYSYIAAFIIVPFLVGRGIYVLADPWIEDESLPVLIALALAFILPIATVRLAFNLRAKSDI